MPLVLQQGTLKNRLHNSMVKPQTFFFFLHGKMFFNITLARLRQNCILKSDLFRFNLIASPNCHVVY